MGTLSSLWIALMVLSILLMDQQIGGAQIPKFLQNKYGTKSASPNSQNGSTNSYTKTYTKTKTSGEVNSNTKSHAGHTAPESPFKVNHKSTSMSSHNGTASKFQGGCNAMPSPMNAGVRCSKYSGCRANCLPKFQFPNGKTHLAFDCVDGQWLESTGVYTNVPNCEPICMPACQNNGICLSPNHCSCPENFSGPQCQFESKPCLNHPPMPMSSKRSCNSKKCTITCAKGFEFPDGSAIATMECKNGMWVPTKEKWVSIPDCQATCTPPCQNGGNCLSFNVCQCPQDFRGPQCQYKADVCSPKELSFNGGYNCSGDENSFSCSVNCPPGIEFEFPPENVYTCTYDLGMFLPVPVPNCLYPEFSEVTFNEGVSESKSWINETKHSSSSSHGGEEVFIKEDVKGSQSGNHEHMVVEQRLPKPGTCFNWGGGHYKTFDNRVYSFNSYCPEVLVRDSKDGTFSIITQNSPSCKQDPRYCHKIINIFLQNVNYVLDRKPEGSFSFKTSDKALPIPGRVPGVRVEMMAHNLFVSMDTVGVQILWDGQLLIQISAKENLWNRTEGLCGILDGDSSTDLVTQDGQTPRNILTLANSWKVDSLDNRCDIPSSEDQVCNNSPELTLEATKFCNKLIADNRFKPCQNVLDIISLYDACRSDYCNCQEIDPSNCACDTFNVYVKHCSHFGVKGLANWRDEKTCPLHCTNGKVYKSCGSTSRQPACGSITEGVVTEESECVEGCFCPEGTVLHEDKCITKDHCPCMLRGKSFPAGHSVPKDCNTCTCSDGTWICTQVDCGARCSAIGDPHYVTFDGKKFDFMGKCSYYLVKTDNFSIEAENIPCAGAISEAMNFPSSTLSGIPTCTKTVTIRINDQIVKLKQNHELVVNGEDITRVPFNIAGIGIKKVSSIFSLTKLPNGIAVWWDGISRVYIDLPAKFPEQTKGLCGSFNQNQKDDFLTPQDDIEQAVIPFANKWKTSEHCPDLPEVIPTHPCDKSIHRRPQAEKYCSRIKEDLFKDCHFFVDPEQFYQDCLFDMCSCEFPVSKCLCPIIASYATECSRQGIKIDWRGEIRECGVHCPGGQKYQVCGNHCTRTCQDIANEPDCKPQCVEGCNCPEGQTIDENGECIPIGHCKCTYRGMEFPAGYKEIRPASKAVELCECANAVWECYEASEEDKKIYPNSDLVQNKCNSSANMEFTSCEPVEPITCKNMHSPELYSPAICHAGCQCKKGYVLDSSTKTCVLPTQCPCHHANKSYKEKSVVQSGCNTCTCQNGKWACTDRQCAAECSAWGDSHYKTFDGKRYDYQGECDYVLSKGSLGSDSYHVSIQNVPCGSLGTACFKSVTLKVTSGDGNDVVSLEKDKSLPSLKTFKHVTLREKGKFVIVEAPELGLVIHWDRGTRVYVRLNPKWKTKTKGLCGNYNDNEMDDFQTPSGGLAEVSPNIFGDSWRLQSYCSEAAEIEDTCLSRPDRKIWSVKKCSILKSQVFAPCHYEVPVQYYFDKCIFDTCACDQGGDCECMCTALAAYAQECNNRGVAIKWRTPEFCPMQCDETCTTYSPCISTCPEETCDNLLMNKKYSKTCGEDVCIEGCAPKPCPTGYVYRNSSHSECVPVQQCKPICMIVNDITYYEGDLMEEDDCHSCYCSREEKKCRGEPCTTTALPSTTLQNEEIVKCQPGWTHWINQDQPRDKDELRTVEIEPVPSSLVLLNLKDSPKCSSDMIRAIECRTVKDGIPAKNTGLDVECSLERGLVCKSDVKGKKVCPDFEIRVLCGCGESTTLIPQTTEAEIVTNAPVCIVGESKLDVYDCTKYYVCTFGQTENRWVEETCAKGTLYNPVTKSCDWPREVYPFRPECVRTTKQPTTEGEIVTTAPICYIGESKVDLYDCTKYYVCTFGQNGNHWIEQICANGSLYHPVTGSCELPREVYPLRPECVKSTEQPTTEAEIITKAPVCYVGESKVDLYDCIKYYVCTFGQTKNRWVEQICAKGTLYNPVKRTCDWPREVYPLRPECVRTTEQPTTEAEIVTKAPICIVGESKVDLYDCTKYYVCSFGQTENQWVEKVCKKNSLYNPGTRTCRPPTEVYPLRPECVRTTEQPSTEREIVTKAPVCYVGERKVDLYDCTKYYVCIFGQTENQWLEEVCEKDTLYNPFTRTCDLTREVYPLRPECVKSTEQPITEAEIVTTAPVCYVGENKVDLYDCTKYYVCTFGKTENQWVEKVCKKDTLYNPVTRTCNRPTEVYPLRPECVRTTKQPTTESEIVTKAPVCYTGESKADLYDCHKYYICKFGPTGNYWTEMDCSDTSLYNPVTRKCDLPSEVISLRPECQKTSYKPTTVFELITTQAPGCNEGEKKEDRDDCSKYYVCVTDNDIYRWVQEMCTHGSLYNPIKRTCDYPSEVNKVRPNCKYTTIQEYTTTSYSTTTIKESDEELFTSAPSCIVGETKFDDADCSIYYVCAPDMEDNKWVKRSCADDTLYNPIANACDLENVVYKVRPICEENLRYITFEPGAICDPGLVYDDCAVECDKLCLYYDYLVKKKGLCRGDVKCEAGCVSAKKRKTCPKGQVWFNENTCVSEESCLCVSEEGKPIKPGKVYEEPGCKKCQCIDNAYSCQPGSCTTEGSTEEEDDERTTKNIKTAATEGTEAETSGTTKTIKTSSTEGTEEETTGTTKSTKTSATKEGELTEVTEEQVSKNVVTQDEAAVSVTMHKTTFAIPSVTPPAECTEDRLIPLIQGDEPLPDEAFTASSVKEDIFAPYNARFSTELSEESGGSWAPEHQNQKQYLEIDLGKQEPVYGVIVKGSPLYDEYVTSYRVQYSPDGHTFYYILDRKNKNPVIFRGSTDSTTEVKQFFDIPVEAKKIRINPKSWNNGISLQVELIGCSETTTQTTNTFKSTTQIVIKTTPSPMLCDDPMGLGDGSMSLSQISVSSSISSKHGKAHLKLTDKSAWQPLTNSPTESILFDFLEPRDITGLVTKGGPDGWVENYIIQYSNDNVEWSTIMYGKKDKIFAGNFNSHMPQVNNFELPIRTRYVKIVPKKWRKNIQMRIEIHGCYQPYPTVVTEESTTVIPREDVCNTCPGVEHNSIEDVCRCLPGKWWDGKECVDRSQCPCVVGYIQYPVGSIFEKEDCSECICKIGGVSFCKPKQCKPCEEGLKSTVTTTCACTCQPCPEETTLCPTSNICINSTLWCNGIEDCPDDEVNCASTTASTEAPTPLISISTTHGKTHSSSTTASQITSKPTTSEPKPCPDVICGPGYKKVIKRSHKKGGRKTYRSQMIRNNNVKTSGVKTKYVGAKGGRGGVKTAPQKWQLATPTSQSRNVKKPQLEECIEYICIPFIPEFNNSQEAIDICPAVDCEDNMILILDEFNQETNCQEFHCESPPKPDSTCSVVGKTFSTFDGVEYKYDICNHVLARDLKYDDWEVSLKKTCRKVCSRDLIIQHDWQKFVFHTDFSVEYDGYTYSLQQVIKLSEKQEDFSITLVGRTVLFTSSKFGFWVLWTQNGNVKIGVDQQLLEKVDGLCGYFDGDQEGDKRKPDGSLAKTTVDFGDSWALSHDQPSICEAKACPIEFQNQAWQMCNKVKEESLQRCGQVMDVESFISRCLETTCTCLEQKLHNETAEESCKCQALQSFVEDCLSTNPKVDISNWRVEQNCPAPCESPLIYNDCYQKRCEPDCSTFSDPRACPKVNDMCFPGCYCPAGYVRQGNNCIPPSSCRNCECDLLPHLTYVTYDEANFTISGNCVYVMSRDVITKDNKEHQFQVLITNHVCSTSSTKSKTKTHEHKNKMCVGKVTILYENHKIHILKDEQRNKLKMIYDGERITDFNDVAEVIKVGESQRIDLKVLLSRIQVVVQVTYPNLGVIVKVPSYTFGGKMEGICGDCNGKEEDDFKKPDGSKPKDVADFGLSWLYENLPGGQTREQCEEPEEEKCHFKPGEHDPCVQLFDENKFGQCSNLVDPTMYLEWCRKDTCNGDLTESCDVLEAYAKECSMYGFCVNWRNNLCPAPTCPPGQFYSPCGPAHPDTCDNVGSTKNPTNNPTKNPTKGKHRVIPTEGCFCPEGKVLLNETCIEPRECITCDNEGHHPGDVWKKDKCTTCKCKEKTLVCDTQQCIDPSTICERGYNAMLVPTGEDECCDKYTCIPEPTYAPTCDPPQNLQCAQDQLLKLETKPNGCQIYICECKPREECEKIDLSSVNPEPGYVKEIDNMSSCCPVVNLVCKKETCPPRIECPQFYSLKEDKSEDKCCPVYSCEAPQKCIVTTEHGAAPGGGERPLTDLEKQKLLKDLGEKWKDGPCRDCKCIVSENGNYVPTCSKATCPDPRTDSDWEEYELIAEKTYNECCPKYKRHACRYNGKVYKVGETWFKESDYCTSFKCVKSHNGYVQKETQVKQCETKCDVGFAYFEPSSESQECCGTCKQVSCIVEGETYPIGKTWTSPDFCTEYVCTDAEGSVQVKSVTQHCPKIPDENIKNFVVETIPQPGKCCPKHVLTACKVEGHVVKVGETYTSEDDLCKAYKCVQKVDNELSIQETVQSCKSDCGKGWKYEKSNTQCCGKCVQVSCVLEGQVWKEGENWQSKDGCTKFSCEKLGDHYSILTQQETCPPIEDCPLENIYIKGCCQFCNTTAEALTQCMPLPMALEDTIGILKVNDCKNVYPITNFTECVGSCESSTTFNIGSGMHQSECSCCQALAYNSLLVELECEGGKKLEKKIEVPSKCGCNINECDGTVKTKFFNSNSSQTTKNARKGRHVMNG